MVQEKSICAIGPEPWLTKNLIKNNDRDFVRHMFRNLQEVQRHEMFMTFCLHQIVLNYIARYLCTIPVLQLK